jgi:HD superfamily phosphohydrolase
LAAVTALLWLYSFAEFAYPGAVHNRFSHSLGTAYLSTLVYSSIYWISSDQDEKISLAITALLHDIGHGPFSHAFEKIINEL